MQYTHDNSNLKETKKRIETSDVGVIEKERAYENYEKRVRTLEVRVIEGSSYRDHTVFKIDSLVSL